MSITTIDPPRKRIHNFTERPFNKPFTYRMLYTLLTDTSAELMDQQVKVGDNGDVLYIGGYTIDRHNKLLFLVSEGK